MRLVDPGTGADDAIEIYIARDIWEGLKPDAEKLLVAIQDHGRFWIRLGP